MRLNREALKPWIGSAVLLPVCIWCLARRGDYTFLDAADLVIHEAGHFLFRFFGFWMHMAGGTLMQLLLPGLIAWHFLRHGYRLGVQVALLWLGQNGLNISVYAADARAQQLPLLGGPHVLHDWHWMLDQLGWLAWDQSIGHGFVGLALVCFAVLLLLPVWMPISIDTPLA